MGLIHIYTGDGKGKTTASLGLLTRAIGASYNVIFCQFLKSTHSSELNVLKNLPNCHIFRLEKSFPFSWLLSEEEKVDLKSCQDELFSKVLAFSATLDSDILIVFDELCASFSKNLIDQNSVISFLEKKPSNVEIVITGRNASEKLINLADYVSEIKKIKHPLDSGVSARKGIER